jgi:hypothetical protein
MFRTIAEREGEQEARQRDESSRQSDFRVQIRFLYAVKAALSVAEWNLAADFRLLISDNCPPISELRPFPTGYFRDFSYCC